MNPEVDKVLTGLIGDAVRDAVGGPVTPRNVFRRLQGRPVASGPGKKLSVTAGAALGLGLLDGLDKLPQNMVPWYVGLVAIYLLCHTATDIASILREREVSE